MYLAKNKKAIKAKIKAAKKKHRKLKRNIPIIAITGSAGKTTSKAFLASILSKKWKTFESSNYWNTTEHTKKHAEEINSEHEAVVLEYGMAYPGVITKHCSIIQPNISIITNIGLAHVGNFDSDIKKLAKAKSEIIHGMDEKGLLILNQDDENSKHLETNEFKGKILTVGVNTNADYRAYDIKYADNGMSFKVRLQGQEIALYIPILGEHHVYNALNAIAVADYLGLTPMEIKTGLLFNAPLQRMTTYHCKNNITIIDDSVHSHPQAVRAAIDVLTHVGKHRKIAVIGQMRELGDLREREYRKVGEYICNKGVDILITYGFRTDEISNQAITKGFPKNNVYHFRNKDDLHALLVNIIKPNDTILIKGASKTKLYETVEFLNGTFG